MKKNNLSREVTIETVVGLFVLMVLLGLGYFTIILSRETWFQKKYHREVVFENVMGLHDGDNVVMRGMPIGKVLSLHLTSDGVHVAMSLDQPVYPRKDYKIAIVSTSMLGGRHLEIDEGSRELEPLSEEVTLHGLKPLDMMADAAEAVNALKRGLVDSGMVDNLKKAVAAFTQIAERVGQGKGTLGRLLSEDDTLYKDLSATVASLKSISGRVEKGEGTLGKLMSGDDKLYKDLSDGVASLKTVAGRLEKGEGTLGRLLSGDDQLYKDLASTMASLKSITERIEKGEGTLGRLVKDNAIYDELTKTISDVRAAVDDFRESTPVVTFTSILLGAF